MKMRKNPPHICSKFSMLPTLINMKGSNRNQKNDFLSQNIIILIVTALGK